MFYGEPLRPIQNILIYTAIKLHKGGSYLVILSLLKVISCTRFCLKVKKRGLNRDSGFAFQIFSSKIKNSIKLCVGTSSKILAVWFLVVMWQSVKGMEVWTLSPDTVANTFHFSISIGVADSLDAIIRSSVKEWLEKGNNTGKQEWRAAGEDLCMATFCVCGQNQLFWRISWHLTCTRRHMTPWSLCSEDE